MSRLVLLVFTKVGFKGSAICRFRLDVSHLLIAPKRAGNAWTSDRGDLGFQRRFPPTHGCSDALDERVPVPSPQQ